MEETTEERFVFSSKLQGKLLATLILGAVLLGLGILLHNNSSHTTEENTHSSTLLSYLIINLWLNNVFFAGISIVGVLFVAIHYASEAGWSTLIKRIPESFGYWLPFAGLLMLGLFLIGSHNIFHWTHHTLYEPTLADGSPNPEYDEIIAGKASFLNTPFYLVRMVVIFAVWYLLFLAIRRTSVQEDIHGGTNYWRRAHLLSVIFIIFFAVSSSVAAWDWIMSIDTHWFSTLFGWYTFASWWVAALALITYIVALLKSAGYLKQVNENHFHDLGKYVFAFTIFWAYLWFSQFMLIYYSNIPEESIYFVERMRGPYAWLFYTNLGVNFFFPFLLLMTRDAKRHTQFLRLVCPVVVIGHWIDFLLMSSPGVLKEDGGKIGLIEIGCLIVFLSLFLFVILRGLSKVSLIPKKDPMLEESIHHHI